MARGRATYGREPRLRVKARVAPVASISASTSRFSCAGFAVLRGFLDDAEVLRLSAEVESVLAQPRPPGCERPNNVLVPLRWDDAIPERILRSEVRLGRLRDAVAAGDLRWI